MRSVVTADVEDVNIYGAERLRKCRCVPLALSCFYRRTLSNPIQGQYRAAHRVQLIVRGSKQLKTFLKEAVWVGWSFYLATLANGIR